MLLVRCTPVLCRFLVSEITIVQSQTAPIPAAREFTGAKLIHRVWPIALIVCGLGLSAAWAAILGFGLVSLIIEVV